MSDFTMKANDTLPSISATLSNTSGPSLDLSGAIVKFIMRTVNGPVKVAAPAVVVTPIAPAIVRYDWLPADTATPGSYTAEWEITFTNGRKQTFPTLTYHTVQILADLDGA